MKNARKLMQQESRKMSARMAGSWIAGLSILTIAGGAAAHEYDGFIYGKVTMRSGDHYEGRLRWGKEEAFWDDLFHSSKVELPAYDELPRGRSLRKDRGGRIELFGGIDIKWKDSGGGTRIFASRFGDIETIEVTGDEDAVVHMKNGDDIEVSGYANDVGNSITVWDSSLGKVDLKWRRIDTIEFMQTPSSIDVDGYRLWGVVDTDAGEFRGWIQWDSEECLSTDILDGESQDGELDIPMGRIRSIEKHRGGSQVELKDGRTLYLDGTQDVDDSIRGIMVEDERYGRVEVRWDAFDRVVFEEKKSSGRAYNTYNGGGRLDATVTDLDGEELRGHIYFDLDESGGFEFLNGSSVDVEYNIPFQMVSVIEPRGSRSARVQLVSGERVRLGDGQDVSDKNDGVLLMRDGEPAYLAWEDLEKIEFHW